ESTPKTLINSLHATARNFDTPSYWTLTFFLASQSKSTCHFQNEDSKCLRVPHSILSAKKQENFSDFLLSKAVKI
ncbi:hypothetical protein, partial [Laedolimicola ammoniilytica]|nr:hypothetical protein [Laedolimicola ammoniilytica]